MAFAPQHGPPLIAPCEFVLDWALRCEQPAAFWAFAGRFLCPEHECIDRLNVDCEHAWTSTFCSTASADDADGDESDDEEAICWLCTVNRDDLEWEATP